jgi:iron complex transport system ATP-binding protein
LLSPKGGFDVKLVGGGLLILFDRPRRVVSSAVLNGGIRRARAILIQQVGKDFNDRDPEGYLRRVVEGLGVEGGVVSLMTAADVSKYGLSAQRRGDLAATAIVTAGVSNAAACGEPVGSDALGTINTVVLVEAWMTDSCLIEAVKTATEAKCRALAHLDVRSVYSGELATGTTTDAVAIAELGGERRLRYCGSGTKLGELIGRAVFEAVVQALEKSEGLRAGRSLLKRLEERGIALEAMVDAGLESFVPRAGLEAREEAAKRLREELLELMSDVNVCSLVLAGLRLEEDASRGLVPGLTASSYPKDPRLLAASGMLGMTIVNYVAGTLGRFEYMGIEGAGSGILRRLGPFAGGVVGALIAGASSRMYSRSLKLHERA